VFAHRFGRPCAGIVLAVALVCGALPAFAGTTGTLTGTVLDASSKAPLAGAKVTAASPSQDATVKTDASGHFTFLSLAPDTYTVSVDAEGYQPAAVAGITIVADNARVLSLSTEKALTTIARVRSRSATSLVRPGTTADQYSVDALQQQKFGGVGGGPEQNLVYSAIATIPGAFVPQGVQGGNGIGADVYIRGGDYDQVGYELDGVPVNRSFDLYPSGPGSALGTQETQVYTGSAPANAEGQGLAGFVNQVIKVGTYPGFAAASVGLGGPAFYHQASIEFGGATENRRFSYYAATGGYDEDFRYGDQFNGASLSNLFGNALAPCSYAAGPVPSCFSPSTGAPYAGAAASGYGAIAPSLVTGGSQAFALGPYNLFSAATVRDRNSVLNLHYDFPHQDGTKDDIQVLGIDDFVSTPYYISTFDQGNAAYLGNVGLGTPSYYSGYQWNGPVGTALPANASSLVSPYLFPQLETAQAAAAGGLIPPDARDAISNNQDILKLQFTKSLGSNALFKLYGYTYYSNWLQIGPQTAYANYFGPAGPDYELSSHTRGVSGTFSDQLDAHNLLQIQGSYTTATTLRDNNYQMYNSNPLPDDESTLAVLVDSSHPFNGLCYTLGSATPTTCNYSGPATFVTLGQLAGEAGALPILPASGTCGGGPCAYYVMNDGKFATYNTVKPKFTSASITDSIRPNDRLTIDAGLRLDVFQFEGDDTNTGAARTFWYNAFNLDNCVDSQGDLFDKVDDLGLASPAAACPSGYSPITVSNPSGAVTETYPVFQPRLGFTYTLDPTTVVRASYGRYSEAPSSAYEQYDTLQTNAPEQLYSTYDFQKLGFLTPNHPVRPAVSNNYDLSFEKQFGGDTSIKLTPFYRSTQAQIQQFFLNEAEGFVSGLNVGEQTAKGIEVELDKGNFARDGIAAKLAFTYTNAYVRYTDLPTGSNLIGSLNAQIEQYNAYTSACAPGGKGFGKPVCGNASVTSVTAAPCYTAGSSGSPGAAITSPASCTAADVANPYWNAPLQALLAVNGDYAPFDLFPAGVEGSGIGTAVSSYAVPYFATFVIQYKHGPLSVTPNVQFSAGERYGAPETTYGIAPDQCSGTLPGVTAGDSRYGYGASGGGAPFDATTCGQLTGGIPDPYTGKFDGIGAFVLPSTLQFGTQLEYDFSSRISLVANFNNLVNTCFGGSKLPWNVQGACSYGVIADGYGADVGNTYNPGAAIQPDINTPYAPVFSTYPFSLSVTAKIRI
jgi:hypothetical protein